MISPHYARFTEAFDTRDRHDAQALLEALRYRIARLRAALRVHHLVEHGRHARLQRLRELVEDVPEGPSSVCGVRSHPPVDDGAARGDVADRGPARV